LLGNRCYRFEFQKVGLGILWFARGRLQAITGLVMEALPDTLLEAFVHS